MVTNIIKIAKFLEIYINRDLLFIIAELIIITISLSFFIIMCDLGLLLLNKLEEREKNK